MERIKLFRRDYYGMETVEGIVIKDENLFYILTEYEDILEKDLQRIGEGLYTVYYGRNKEEVERRYKIRMNKILNELKKDIKLYETALSRE